MGTPARDLHTIIGDIKFNTETLNKIADGMQECVDKNLPVNQFNLIAVIGCEAEKKGAELMREFNEAIDSTDMNSVNRETLGMYMYFLSMHGKAHENVCNKLEEIFHLQKENE